MYTRRPYEISWLFYSTTVERWRIKNIRIQAYEKCFKSARVWLWKLHSIEITVTLKITKASQLRSRQAALSRPNALLYSSWLWKLHSIEIRVTLKITKASQLRSRQAALSRPNALLYSSHLCLENYISSESHQNLTSTKASQLMSRQAALSRPKGFALLFTPVLYDSFSSKYILAWVFSFYSPFKRETVLQNILMKNILAYP